MSLKIMNPIKVHVTGEHRSFISKARKNITVFKCYVFLGNSPYPEKIDVFGSPVAAGYYAVPLKVNIYNGRLSAILDFEQAKLLESK